MNKIKDILREDLRGRRDSIEELLENVVQSQECLEKNQYRFQVAIYVLLKNKETKSVIVTGEIGESKENVILRSKQEFVKTHNVSIKDSESHSIDIMVLYGEDDKCKIMVTTTLEDDF